jgi:hypothetical protein
MADGTSFTYEQLPPPSRTQKTCELTTTMDMEKKMLNYS